MPSLFFNNFFFEIDTNKLNICPSNKYNAIKIPFRLNRGSRVSATHPLSNVQWYKDLLNGFLINFYQTYDFVPQK